MENKVNEDILKSNQCLVCVLDILGFKTLLNEHQADDIFETLSSMFYAFTKQKDSIGITNELFQNMQFQYFGDTTFIVMDLQNFQNKLKIIDDFLRFIATFAIFFIAQTQYFIRGGIGFGNYSQKKMFDDKMLFIYSESLNEAVNLEKKADVPRILVSDKLIEHIHKLGLSDLSNTSVLRSSDDCMFVDIYSGYDKVKGFDALGEIRSIAAALIYQCSKNINNRKVLEKYYWFQEYHNKKMEEFFKRGLVSDKENLLVKIPYQI